MATIQELIEQEGSSLRLTSSASDFEDFKKSHVWQDMLKVIQMHTEADTSRLLYAENTEDVRVLQGRLQVAKDVENLPDYIINLIQVDDA